MKIVVVGSLLVLLVVGSCLSARTASMHDQIDRLEPGHWLEIVENADGTIKNSRISAVWPSRQGHPAWGVIGPRGVTDAWGGGAYDAKRELFIVTGGGHRDYGGNEVYAFDMRKLAWRRLTDPSRYAPDLNSTIDATPVSRHTYDGIEYLAGVDRIAIFAGSVYPSGSALDRRLWLFDVERGRWRRRAAAPDYVWPAAAAAAYDPVSGFYYAYAVGRLAKYDPVSDVWMNVVSGPGISDGTMELDPANRRLVFSGSGRLWTYSLDNPVGAMHAIPADDRAAETASKEGPGLAYDPRSRKVIVWAGGRTVWALDTLSSRWDLISSPHGPAPGSTPDARGIYGKWRYVPSRDVFIGLPSSESNVWLFRAPGDKR